MVQRKVSNKLGTQSDHVKSEKLLANLKPSSYHYQDGNSRGPDMKKKMKRSRSVKLPDVESLRLSPSTTLKQTISQPGKPPPLNVTTLQKQHTPVRTNYRSPNYMKGTSSSEARKESSQVNSRRSSSSSKSKLGSCSSNKPTGSLTKSSSLKLIRTLTKTPSFKHVKAGSKKCSRVVLCADVNAQRATCASTLKDSKFPDYLVLNPRGTEVEGTSVLKVCPYTYCSLNGHHHKPLLPLKCFLSSRRQMLKTQKNMKLEALSQHRVKPVGEGREGIDAGQVFFYNKPAYIEGDLDSSPMSPLIQERGMDFFIKIYAKSEEENGESIHKECHEAEVEHNNDKQIAEDLTAGSPCSEIDFEENLQQCQDVTSMGVDIMEDFTEEEDPDKDYSAIAAQTEVPDDGSDFEDESSANSEDNGSFSEASDMEWEEGQFPTLDIDTEADDSTKDDYESDFDSGYLSEINNHQPGEPITKSENIVVGGSEKIEADEIFEEESPCSETLQGEIDFEMDAMHQNLEIIESSQVSDSDQESTTEDLFGVMITFAWTEDQIVEPIASIEKIEEKTEVPEAENEIPGIGPHVGNVQNYCTHEATDDTFNHQHDESVQDDDLAMRLQNQISDSFQDSDKGDHVVIKEDCNGSQDTEDSKRDLVSISEFHAEQDMVKNEAGNQMEEKEQVAVTKRSIGVQVPDDLFEVYPDDGKVDDNRSLNVIHPDQLEDSSEDAKSAQGSVDEICPAENQEHPSESEYSNTNVAENQNIAENEDEDEVKKLDIPSSMVSEEESDSMMNKISLAESGIGEVEKMEVEDSSELDTTEMLPMTGAETIPKLESTTLPLESKSKQELLSTCSNQKWTIRCKRDANDEEEMRNFNPREPNFLPMVPEPDAEKVDLKHQMMIEKKNSEEWMVDFALRQAVTKLAPARKRKVALLVEAFEAVIPLPKYETRLKHASAAFAPARPMQACS